MNAIMNRLQAVRRTSTISRAVVAKCGPCSNTGEKVIRLRRKIPLCGPKNAEENVSKQGKGIDQNLEVNVLGETSHIIFRIRSSGIRLTQSRSPLIIRIGERLINGMEFITN